MRGWGNYGDIPSGLELRDMLQRVRPQRRPLRNRYVEEDSEEVRGETQAEGRAEREVVGYNGRWTNFDTQATDTQATDTQAQDPTPEGPPIRGHRTLPRGNYLSDWYDNSTWSAMDWNVTEENNEEPF